MNEMRYFILMGICEFNGFQKITETVIHKDLDTSEAVKFFAEDDEWKNEISKHDGITYYHKIIGNQFGYKSHAEAECHLKYGADVALERDFMPLIHNCRQKSIAQGIRKDDKNDEK